MIYPPEVNGIGWQPIFGSEATDNIPVRHFIAGWDHHYLTIRGCCFRPEGRGQFCGTGQRRWIKFRVNSPPSSACIDDLQHKGACKQDAGPPGAERSDDDDHAAKYSAVNDRPAEPPR